MKSLLADMLIGFFDVAADRNLIVNTLIFLYN